MRWSFSCWVAVLASVGTGAAPAGEPVAIELPIEARLDLSAYRSLTVIPFIAREAEGSRPLGDVEGQLLRYLARTIARRTELDVDTLALELPTHEPDALAANESFWRYLCERTGSDLIVAGAVDLDLQDRSGYVTRELISERDGRTYYAQVLVESTGIDVE